MNSSDVPEGISTSELNARLERGYRQALAGHGKSVDEVFNKLLGGRSWRIIMCQWGRVQVTHVTVERVPTDTWFIS